MTYHRHCVHVGTKRRTCAWCARPFRGGACGACARGEIRRWVDGALCRRCDPRATHINYVPTGVAPRLEPSVIHTNQLVTIPGDFCLGCDSFECAVLLPSIGYDRGPAHGLHGILWFRVVAGPAGAQERVAAAIAARRDRTERA